MNRHFFFLLMLFFSCNNQKQLSNNNLEQKESQPNKELVINFSFKTNKSDQFKIMVNKIKVDEYQSKNVHVIEEIFPTTGADEIVANFGENNISNSVLIQLGNKEVKDVEIIDITATYGENTISIKTPQEQVKYLAFNKFIEKDSTSNILKTKRVNGVHNPVIYFKRNLINLLKK